MPKITIELDEQEENYDLELYTNRYKMAHMLDEVQNLAREYYKYDERSEIPTSEIKDKLDNILSDWYYLTN